MSSEPELTPADEIHTEAAVRCVGVAIVDVIDHCIRVVRLSRVPSNQIDPPSFADLRAAIIRNLEAIKPNGNTIQ